MSYLKGFFIIICSLLLVMYAEVIAYADTASHQPHSYSSAIKNSAPSVVSVFINSEPGGPSRNHLNHSGTVFGYTAPATLGSAVIINKEGYLLTNYHVIQHAQRIIIVTADGRRSVGTIVGYDKATDLAVLKIGLNNLSSARLGNSDQVDVGDVVFAIGNAFGLGQSVTQGIVSAIRRHAAGVNALKRFIQTDVAMNPGNSGGPLINAKGEVIGINSSIYSHSGGYQGISFSIPINVALHVMQKIIKAGRVDRGWLGVKIRTLLPRNNQSGKFHHAPGIVVVAVLPLSPAKKSGIQPGDVVTSLNHQPVKTALTFLNNIAQLSPGSRVKLTYFRENKKQDIEMVVGRRPSSSHL